MKALIIDTSIEISCIIVIENREIIFFKKIKENLSKNIFLELQNILDQTNISISDLGYIATSIGPGSFTSLRIGANIAKTFSYVKKIPLISYISMQGYIPDISSKTINQDTKFLVAFDAKSQGVYLTEGLVLKNSINHISDPKLFSLNEALLHIEKNDIVISPHAELLKNKFEKFKNKFYKKFLDPNQLIDITYKKYVENKFEKYSSFNLLYLRGPKLVE